MKTLQHLCVVVFLLLLISTTAMAQSVGDYRSVASGEWNATATWERFDGTNWVAATSAPTMGTNVTIRSGHTITLGGTRVGKNMIIENGGKVWVNAPLPQSARYLRLRPDSIVVDGTFGDATVGDRAAIEIAKSSATVKITGTGTFAPSIFRVVDTNNTCTVILDIDTKIMYTGSDGNGAVGLYPQSNNNTIVVNAGKTLTFVNKSYLSATNSATGAAAINATFNVYGTIDLSGANSLMNLRAATGNTVAMNIYSGGSVTVGNNIYTSTVANGGTTSLLLDGSLTCNGPTDFSNPSFVVTGTGTFTLGSGASLSIGHPEGITASGSTGQIQTNTRNFSTGANYLYVGTSAQATGDGLPASVNNLTINNTNGVTLSSSTSVNGTLTFTNGVVTTGANVLGISSTGSISGTGGWVNGHLSKYVPTGHGVIRSFEIGNASNSIPVSVTFYNVSGSGDLIASTTDGDHPQVASSKLDASKTVNRYYTLTNSGIAFDQYDATLNFLSGDIDPSADYNKFIVQQYDGVGWADLYEGTKTSTSTQILSATSFSDFAIGEELPVPLFELSATNIDFGNVVVGNSKIDSVFLRNIGTVTLHVDSIVSNNADFTVNSTSYDINAGDSAKITVTFAPSGLGSANANITFYHNAASSPDVLTASGNGIPVPPVVSNGTGGGDWNVGSTWIGGVVPVSTDNVEIQSGDSVYLTSAGTCTNLTLKSNAKLALNAASLTIPGSSWTFDPTSTVYYNGTTTVQSAPAYGNLVYATGSSGTTNGNLTINGNLYITANTFRGISATSGSYTHTVAGNVIVGPGTSARITAVNYNGATSASCTWNIGGNVSLTGNSSGNRVILYESAGPHTGDAIFNIDGNLTIGAGSRIDFRSSTNATASDTGYINLKGNLTNNGTIICPSGATAGLLVLNLAGTSAQNYTGAFPSFSSAACELRVNNNAGVTLGSPATVTQRVTLNLVNGLLTTTSTNLLICSTGTISGGSASSFVSGPLAFIMPAGTAVARNYPIGDAAVYAPVSVTFGNITTGDTLIATTTSGDHPQLGTSGIYPVRSVNRFWTFVDQGLVFDTYDAVFNFASGDVDPGANPSSFIAQKYDGSTWSDLTEGTRTSTSTEITGATSFSDFALGERGPVTVLSNGTGGGDWSSNATWQGGIVPSSIDSVVLLGTDSVYVLSDYTCSGLNILSGAKLTLGDTLRVDRGTISGYVYTIGAANASALLKNDTLTFKDGSLYQHGIPNGVIPLAKWDAGSTCTITGYTSGNKPNNPNQNFYNFVWDCSGQTANVDMSWYNNTIAGDITIKNTGTMRMQMTSPGAGTPNTITINGNIKVEGGSFTSNGSGSAADITINTYGNINVTGGNFSVSRGSGPNVIWNLYGDFSMTNATTQNSAPAKAGFYIAGSSPQNINFTNMTFNGTVPVTVNNGAYLNVTMAGNTYTAGGFQFTGSTGSTINMGTSAVEGSGAFTLNDGATLICANAGGLDVTLSNTGTKTLSSAASYVYNGTAAQVTGALLPANVADLTINNSNGVTLSSSVTVNDTLFLLSGNVTTGVNTLAIGGTGWTQRTSGHVVGTFKKNVASGSGVARTFEIGDASNYTPVDVTFANVTTAGDLTATTTASEHPQIASSIIDPSKSLNRYYTLTNSGVGFDQYNATFNFVAGDVDAGANTGNFLVQKYDGSTWTDLTEGTRTATSTQILGATSFSDFAIGEELIGVFTITATAGPHGSISPSGDVGVIAGEDQEFIFTPDECYQIDSVYVDGSYIGAPSSYTFTNVSDNHTIRVTFAQIQYTITVIQGDNGTITPGSIIVLCGGTQAFTITPNEGYHIDSVFVDNVYVPDSTTSYTFVDVTANHSITAKFAINTYTLTINVVGSGSVSRTPDLPVYPHGTSVDLEAVPDDISWEFKEWSGDLTGSTNPTSIIMNGPKSVTATFEQNPAYLVTYRSFIVDSIAFDTDTKGKAGKYIKRKPDKVDFEFFVVNPFILTSPGLHVEFGYAIDSANFPFGTIPPSVATCPDGKMKKWDFAFTSLNPNDTVWVYGFGTKGKPQKVSKYYWTDGGVLTGSKLKTVDFTRNVPKMPMPNRINALYETFLNGGYGTTGMVVGQVRTDSNKYFGWFQTLKYGDVWKSLNSKGVLHTGLPHGFDYFASGKPLVKQQKKLEPTKYNNTLFANLVALKFNITASAMGITPVGFGELIYDEPSITGPFDGMMIKDIATYADQIMMGWLVDTTINGKPAKGHRFLDPSAPGSFNDLDYAVARINSAFEGELDTTSFAENLVFSGYKSLLEVPYLRANPGVIPSTIVPLANIIPQEPSGYSLYQNYPNPFNPVTTIEFDLPTEAFVTLKVYNMLGQEVATLLDNELMSDGTQDVQFDATKFASGVYFYRIVAEGVDEDGNLGNTKFHQVMKMVLIK